MPGGDPYSEHATSEVVKLTHYDDEDPVSEPYSIFSVRVSTTEGQER